MPSYNGDMVIYYPNKAGGNNALIAADRDAYFAPKNVVQPAECSTAFMTCCDPRSRYVSMWRFMSKGRMSKTSKYVGTNFEEWARLYLAQRAKDKHPYYRNSWWLTLKECADIIGNPILLPAEDMNLCIQILGDHGWPMNKEDMGVHANTYRHRQGWEDEYTHDLLNDLIEQDKMLCWF